MHIAESVVNRILNVSDGLIGPGAELPVPPPAVPDPTKQGATLDAKLTETPSEGLPGIDQAPDPGATAAGKPLLATMLEAE